jgi:hypothetical protein
MSEDRKQRTRYTVRNGRLCLSKWETSTAFEAFWCSLFDNNFSLAVLLVYTHDNERTTQETQLPIYFHLGSRMSSPNCPAVG